MARTGIHLDQVLPATGRYQSGVDRLSVADKRRASCRVAGVESAFAAVAAAVALLDFDAARKRHRAGANPQGGGRTRCRRGSGAPVIHALRDVVTLVGNAVAVPVARDAVAVGFVTIVATVVPVVAVGHAVAITVAVDVAVVIVVTVVVVVVVAVATIVGIVVL